MNDSTYILTVLAWPGVRLLEYNNQLYVNDINELSLIHVEKQNAYSTWYSQAVSHPSTNQARPCLASEIRRDRACSGWYGRKQLVQAQNQVLYSST